VRQLVIKVLNIDARCNHAVYNEASSHFSQFYKRA